MRFTKAARQLSVFGVLSVTAVYLFSDAAPAADNTAPVVSAPPTRLEQRSDLHISDRVKLSFYERLDSDQDRWRSAGGQSVETPRDFHERTELSGEYVIQDDGTISLPLLGQFTAAGQPNSVLLAAIKASFEDLIGRKGFVNLLGIEHRPIYVVGPVKNSGAFPFEPGLTPLHVVALAGGLRQEAVDNWQQVEAGRQMEQLQASLERVKHLMADTFVLKTERDGDRSQPPELIGLIGSGDMQLLSANERAQRQLVDMSRKSEQSALTTTLDNARSELKAREDRVTPYDGEAKLLAERVNSLQQLVAKGLVARPVLIQAQSALSELQDRRSQAEVEVEAAKDKVSQADRELSKAQAETKIEIARAVAASEQQTDDAVTESEGALNIMRTIAATQRSSGDIDNVVYEIVRRGPDGVVSTRATDMATLEPGDLVRIRMKNAHDDPLVAGQ